jgi:predicted secreted protein
MSAIGYNGRSFVIQKDDAAIAAVRTKTATHAREPVDVTNDDSSGNRVLLPDPAQRSIDVQIAGVVTSNNYQDFLEEWNGSLNSSITIANADGSTEEAEFGFFLSNLEFTGEYNGHVAFTATLMSSGAVTLGS